MVILQTSDLGSARAHASERGVRVAWEVALDDAAAVHLHPRDVGGAILSFDWMARPDLWRWAGPEWRRHVRTEVVRRIAGVDLQAEDWRRLARRWAEVVGRPLVDEVEGRPRVDETALHLDEGVLRFGPPEDERGTGIVRVVLECADAPRALAAARARGLPVREDGGAPEVSIAGTWLQLASRATGGGTR